MRGWRLGALVVSLLLLQVALFPHLRVFGVVPDLGLLAALAVAYRYGPERGALVGFAAGFGYDLFLATPTGLSALSYALTAYAVGVLQGGLLREPRAVAPFLGLLGGLASGAIFAAIGIVVGVDALRVDRTIAVIALAAVYDGVLAPFVFPLVSRAAGRDTEVASGWAVGR